MTVGRKRKLEPSSYSMLTAALITNQDLGTEQDLILEMNRDREKRLPLERMIHAFRNRVEPLIKYSAVIIDLLNKRNAMTPLLTRNKIYNSLILLEKELNSVFAKEVRKIDEYLDKHSEPTSPTNVYFWRKSVTGYQNLRDSLHNFAANITNEITQMKNNSSIIPAPAREAAQNNSLRL